jgi:hypothetical protein
LAACEHVHNVIESLWPAPEVLCAGHGRRGHSAILSFSLWRTVIGLNITFSVLHNKITALQRISVWRFKMCLNHTA